MAVYPLKNIAIGGNTYQIQSGSKSYRVKLEASLNTPNNIASLSIKDILDTYASSIQWDIIYIACLEDGTSYDPQQVMIDDLDGMKYYYASYDFQGGDTSKFGDFINWQPDDEQASTVMFGIGDYGPNDITGLVSVSVDNQTNIVSDMRLSNFGGGGGGGSSVTTYYLYNEWGSASTFASLGSASACVLRDSNSANVNISALNTAFTAGTVYIQDADGAKTRVMTVGYTSGSIRYFYMLMPLSVSGAKLKCCDWQTNKYQMYDVTL